MRRFAGLLLVFVLLALTQVVAAQDVEEYVEITTRGGSTFIGQVISETDLELRFKTIDGAEVTINVSDIVSRRTVRGRSKENGLLRLDPTASRLFFTATARPLAKRAAYVSVYEVFFGFFAAGITDQFTFSGGMSLIPGAPEQLFYIAPKLTVYNQNDRSVAVGMLAGGITGETGMGGLLYGVTTLGPPDGAVSMGAGFLFGGGEIEATPIILVGGEKQVSSKFKLMSENYIIPIGHPEFVLSGGFRIIGGSLTTDLSLFTVASVLTDGGFPFLPWVSFSYNFGY